MSGWFWVIAVVLLLGSFAGWSWLHHMRAATEPGVPFAGPHPANPARTPRALRTRKGRTRALRVIDRDRFLVAWHSTTSRFVDDPAQAISEADRLLADIMEARGLPMLDFDAASEELTVSHPHLAEHYRAARRIARQSEAGVAGTEALHRGLSHYKSMIDELLEVGRRPSATGF
jgi:hypothetical protein